jgi:hypothetical protein
LSFVIFEKKTSMRLIQLLFVLNIGLNFSALAQSQNTSLWIDFNKSYLKVEVEKDGVYRISFEELSKSGLSRFTNLGLWYHGKPMAIKTVGEVNGELKAGGYIEFFGEKNKGSLDSLVYRPTWARNNLYQSLFSDVSAYFLCADNTNPLRVKNSSTSPGTTQNNFRESFVWAPNTQYSFNNNIGLLPELMQSYYQPGEGWTSKFVSASDSSSKYVFTLPGFVKTSLNTTLKLKLNGRSRVYHSLDFFLNNTKIESSVSFGPFDSYSNSYDISEFESAPSLNLEFKTRNANVQYDWYSPTFFEFVYSRSNASLSETARTISLLNPIGTKETYVFGNMKNDKTRVWEISDISQANELGGVNSNLGLSFSIDRTANSQKVFVFSETLSPKKTQILNLTKNTSKPELLIITTPTLKESALKYADYRASDAGGKYKVAVVYTDDIYNAYFYGEKNPKAISYFLEDALKDSPRKFLLLMGKAVTFPDAMKISTETVPSFGYPGSDVLLSAGLWGGSMDVQAVPTGRLNASKNEEVLAYLDKVKESEAAGVAQEWKKNILHLSGGQNVFEINSLRFLLNAITPKAAGGLYGGSVTAKVKATDAEVEEIDISKEINQGVGMLSFAGHGSTDVIDLNIGYSSSPQRNYSNKGKYPLMFFNGCGVGNVFYRYNTLSTDWIVTPNKGAIGVFANSYWSYLYPTQRYLEVLYDKLFVDPELSKLTIGEIHKAVNQALVNESGSDYIRAEMHQMVFQGDPALKLFPIEKPDFSVENNKVFLQSAQGLTTIGASDSLLFGVFMKNLGRLSANQVIKGAFTLKYAGGKEQTKTIEFKSNQTTDTLFVPFKSDVTIEEIALKLDADNKIEEYNELNNEVKLSFKGETTWDKLLNFTLFPEGILPDKVSPKLTLYVGDKILQNADLVALDARFKLKLLDDRNLDLQKSLVEVYLKKCETCEIQTVDLQNAVFTRNTSNDITLSLPNLDLQAGKYSIYVRAKDMVGNVSGPLQQIDFEILTGNSASEIKVSPNPTQDFAKVSLLVNDNRNPSAINVMVYDLKGKLIESQSPSATVGLNEYYLGLKQKWGAGSYIIQVTVSHADGQTEVLKSRVLVF